mmetsp:Transcript_65071/g.121246  ORF Transcript_65071/g.121246 Transcript_65071/m.121246 type:complete len:270 (-) Transcript_65071:326-1135(-)
MTTSVTLPMGRHQLGGVPSRRRMRDHHHADAPDLINALGLEPTGTAGSNRRAPPRCVPSLSFNRWHDRTPPMPRRLLQGSAGALSNQMAPQQRTDLVADLHMHLVAIDDFRQGLLRLLAEAEGTHPAALEGFPITSADGELVAPLHENGSSSEEDDQPVVDAARVQLCINETTRLMPYKACGGCAASCSICLEPFCEEDELRLLPCMHAFHRTCTDAWLFKGRLDCPLCRHRVCAATAEPPVSSDVRSAPHQANDTDSTGHIILTRLRL